MEFVISADTIESTRLTSGGSSITNASRPCVPDGTAQALSNSVRVTPWKVTSFGFERSTDPAASKETGFPRGFLAVAGPAVINDPKTSATASPAIHFRSTRFLLADRP